MKKLTKSLFLLLALVASSGAYAQEKNCVSLKTEGQKEESYTDAQGKPAKRLVALGKVVPGDVVIWTITANNACAKPAEKVVINNNVPEHMAYVADTAMGVGAEITFSVNGKDFGKLEALSVRDAEGKVRPARAEDVKAIRWVLGTPIAPNAMSYVRYRAKLL